MYECLACGYCYVPESGAPSRGISPGTLFEDLPEGFLCPSCQGRKAGFIPVGSVPPQMGGVENDRREVP